NPNHNKKVKNMSLQTASKTTTKGQAMPHASTAKASKTSASNLTFTTKFGEITLNPNLLLSFPHGLFGFRECTQFGLAKLPGMESSPLMLMQCTNQPAIAFLVADPSQLGLEISAEDKTDALKQTKLNGKTTQFLTILTLYDSGESYYLTANLKAPVLVESQTQTGVQFILNNKSYSTQHKI
ncbi:MAG: hypothetical protein EBR79_01215, partial [Proteobacteria bacterium]|nr:hypothetical protein [Pseudomonadota bacterium]